MVSVDGKRINVAYDDCVGKIFVVISQGRRRCLICDRVFTEQGAAEHAGAVCYPSKGGF